jgi:hypothetical protein
LLEAVALWTTARSRRATIGHNSIVADRVMHQSRAPFDAPPLGSGDEAVRVLRCRVEP